MVLTLIFFFFNDTATTEIYTLSLHDALPISSASWCSPTWCRGVTGTVRSPRPPRPSTASSASPLRVASSTSRSEEHTSELQSRLHLVCRLLLEKKKKIFENHEKSLNNTKASS